MKSLVIWIVTALLFTAAGGGVAYVWLEAREQGASEEGRKAPATPESQAGASAEQKKERLTHDAAGNVTLLFDRQSQARVGIELKPLAEAVYRPELIAYGTLQEDPALAFTVRAPLPGAVATAGGGHWPTLGEVVTAGAVVGVLEPRLGPVERADLAARLAGARADVQQAKATLEAMQTALDSKRRLHDQGKIVSDQALLEAEAQVKGEEAKLKGTTETVEILESFMSSATTRPAESVPLVVHINGRVTESPIRPGEFVDSGQPILKVSCFDRLLARISLPAGENLDARVTQARIVVPGREEHPLPAERVAIAPLADSVTGGQVFLYSLQADDTALQPGMSVIARLELPGEPRRGVIVPRSAVIRFGGLTWVYVQTGEEQLTRRQVPVDTAAPEGWFVGAGLQPGDSVVVRGAQTVFSEELRFGTEEEEE